MPLGLPVIRELLNLRQRFNDLVDEVETGALEIGELANGPFRPAADLYESADGLVFVLEVPGVDAESVDVQLSGDRLWVTGRIGRSAWVGEYLQLERASGAFRREFRVAGGVPHGTPVTSVERGVLTVTVPRQSRCDGAGEGA